VGGRMMGMTKPLSYEESKFINEVVDKEIFFAMASGERNDLVDLVAYYVNWEKEKLENEEIGSDDYEKDIATAQSILKKLDYKEEE
jgi:hypothetical protein